MSRSDEPRTTSHPSSTKGARLVHVRGAGADNPITQQGSDHPSAKLFPIQRPPPSCDVRPEERQNSRNTPVRYPPSDVRGRCKPDARTSGGGRSSGGSIERCSKRLATGKCRDGLRSSWTRTATASATSSEPNQPVDPTKDKRLGGAFYSVAPAADGSVWGSVLGFPGAIVRLNPGSNPPETALAEVYEPPVDNPKAPVHGFSPRGADIDRDGVAWVALASGHMASFDRSKCKGPLNGPDRNGPHCPEGWRCTPSPCPR